MGYFSGSQYWLYHYNHLEKLKILVLVLHLKQSKSEFLETPDIGLFLRAPQRFQHGARLENHW